MLLNYTKKIANDIIDNKQYRSESCNIPEIINNYPVYVFVTIRHKDRKKHEMVLGCVRNSYKMVLSEAIKQATKSALRDSRMDNSVPFNKMDISVTILGNPIPLNNINDYNLGNYGLTLIRQGSSTSDIGVYFLADVAVEQKWDKQTTLKHLLSKGGIYGNYSIYQVPEIKLENPVIAGGRIIKKVRKHKGIIQTGKNKGRLKKGYKYSGRRTKNGMPIILKVKKRIIY